MDDPGAALHFGTFGDVAFYEVEECGILDFLPGQGGREHAVGLFDDEEVGVFKDDANATGDEAFAFDPLRELGLRRGSGRARVGAQWRGV
jgi:hypothetical protein